jgi:phosphoribosylanthranilate isomerase
VTSVRVKVCCIASLDEARLAIAHGASAIGLVSAMPSGPGPIEEALIAEIAAAVPAGIDTFLLTSKLTVDAIADQIRRTGVTTIQVCDDLPENGLRELRAAVPDVAIIQVVHVDGNEALRRALAVAGDVDAILLDSGNQKLAVKELGGTGRRHDWTISRRIRQEAGVPVYLAGGLTAANAAEAIDTVRPYALDVCSGVRSEGRLDAGKLAAFFAAVRAVPPAAVC